MLHYLCMCMHSGVSIVVYDVLYVYAALYACALLYDSVCIVYLILLCCILYIVLYICIILLYDSSRQICIYSVYILYYITHTIYISSLLYR